MTRASVKICDDGIPASWEGPYHQHHIINNVITQRLPHAVAQNTEACPGALH